MKLSSSKADQKLELESLPGDILQTLVRNYCKSSLGTVCLLNKHFYSLASLPELWPKDRKRVHVLSSYSSNSLKLMALQIFDFYEFIEWSRYEKSNIKLEITNLLFSASVMWNMHFFEILFYLVFGTSSFFMKCFVLVAFLMNLMLTLIVGGLEILVKNKTSSVSRYKESRKQKQSPQQQEQHQPLENEEKNSSWVERVLDHIREFHQTYILKAFGSKCFMTFQIMLFLLNIIWASEITTIFAQKTHHHSIPLVLYMFFQWSMSFMCIMGGTLPLIFLEGKSNGKFKDAFAISGFSCLSYLVAFSYQLSTLITAFDQIVLILLFGVCIGINYFILQIPVRELARLLPDKNFQQFIGVSLGVSFTCAILQHYQFYYLSVIVHTAVVIPVFIVHVFFLTQSLEKIAKLENASRSRSNTRDDATLEALELLKACAVTALLIRATTLMVLVWWVFA